MDDLAANLLTTLKKPTAPMEAKLTQFNNLKSSIKHQRIPETAQPNTVECIRLAIISQTSSALVTTGLSALGHLIKRLTLQEQMSVLFSHRPPMMPVLLEKLGDAKESYRSAASQNLYDMWPAKPLEVEKIIREGAIMGSNVRAKEMGMQWVSKMHVEQGLQFRSFVAPMVSCLEDADGNVRESAKTNLVELFRNARDSAKADLKKQLIAYNVRKSIASHILSQLQVPVPAEFSSSGSQPNPSRSEKPVQEHAPIEHAMPEPSLPPSAETTTIEPMYVYTARELEDSFKAMHPSFEDKETEDNWKARDKNVLKLRRLLKGNGPSDFHIVFVQGIKGLVEGILKVANSLRTTMSTSGCQLIQELARTLGPAIDPMAETFLRGLEKMCAATKHISAENGNTTVDIIIAHVTYNHRLLDNIWNACQDKNAQPRCFAAGWLKTILKKQAPYKSSFEHSGGVTSAERCIKKGLSDANPKAREAMRTTYWVFAKAWPDRASAIMDSLDPKSQGLLQKHPDNPNPTHDSTSFTSSVGPSAASNPRLATSTSRASLRETIAKQKQATLAAKQRMPERPNSAMSAFSPVKEEPPSARRAPAAQASIAASGTRTASGMSHASSRSAVAGPSTSSNPGSLMSAPIRRPRRADPPRPATADPYANKIPGVETPTQSPGQSPPPRTASKALASKASTSHIEAKSTTTTMIPGPESPSSSRNISPRVSPAKSKHRSAPHPSGIPTPTSSPRSSRSVMSPPSKDENLTMVMPPDGKLPYRSVQQAHPAIDESDRPESGYSQLDVGDEDQFTMVMPPTSILESSRGPGQVQSENEPLDTSNPVLDEDVRTADAVGQIQTPIGKGTQAPTYRDVEPVEVNEGIARAADPMEVYEDPQVENRAVLGSPGEKMALEELPVNEQNPQVSTEEAEIQHRQAVANQDERPVSPSKKDHARAAESAPQDRAEVLKNRRLLSSGIERIRSRNIDAHGFRRLQDLVKSNPQSLELNFADLLLVLLDFLVAPSETINTSASKAQSLKSQCISTIRGVAVLQKRDERVKDEYPLALCTVISARKLFDNATHVGSDLEKTANEILKHAEEKVEACTDAVLDLVENSAQGSAIESPKMLTMALGVLSKLCAMKKSGLTTSQRQRMSASAVRFLGDTNPDIRRAGTELSLELYEAFDDGEKGKAEFWKALRGAGESHLNLVAYYLARRGKA